MTKNISGEEITDYPELKKLKVEYWTIEFEQLEIEKEAERKVKELGIKAKEIRDKFNKLNSELGANDSLALFEPALMSQGEEE